MASPWLGATVADGQFQPSAGWIALDAALLVGLIALLPRRPWSVGLAWGAAVAVLLVTLVAIVDLVFRVSLGRPLNLFLDLYLVSAVYNLAVGNMGLPMTLLAIFALILILSLATFGLARLLTPSEAPRWWLGPRLAGVGLAVLAVAGFAHQAPEAVQRRLAVPVVDLARSQRTLLVETWRERGRFREELASPDSYAGAPGLLTGLKGSDVLLTFIESYGMAAIEDPEFAAVLRPRLDTLAERMDSAGIHLVTGKLVSPTTGGQSWYAHGTVVSGLWLSNQLRYELLLASTRETLVDDFRHAGYRTAVLMPAITMRWPDGVRLGYDAVHTAANISYGGPPLYWVTMPDQFTWSYLQRTVRRGDPSKPQFVETAMVSSHAPWTPILPMIDWNRIGDGSGFEPFRQEGHPPEELWIDIDVLREQYARSIDYSLQAMTGYAERFLDDRTLLIVLGDHQAAPWVTGAASAEVPIHVMARDPALLQPFLDWGLVPGGYPNPTQAAHRMDEFRGWFVRAFSAPGAAPTHSKGEAS